jgi:hypothetical protein
MPTWMTAAQIAERYVVGEDRLIAYSHRGNLPFRRSDEGATLFDERAVARFFRPRGHGLVAARPARGPHLGLLGVVKLGDKPTQNAAPSTPYAPNVRSLRPSSLERTAGFAGTGTDEG